LWLVMVISQNGQGGLFAETIPLASKRVERKGPMFKEMLKLIRLEIELREEVVSAIEALEENKRLRRQVGSIEIQATTRKPRRKQTRKSPTTAEKKKRNAKARAAYRAKHPEQATTTTSRLQALPSKPTSIGPGRGKGSRANTSQAVIDTLKRSPSPLTLEEIDTDLEKAGWPYKGQDRKGAIRATLARPKANGTVSAFMRGTGMDAMKMFRLERTNGDTPSPVEQALNGPTREERAEVEDSEQQMLQDEARADAEGDPDAREF